VYYEIIKERKEISLDEDYNSKSFKELYNYFNNKCVYCETPFNIVPLILENFRPSQGSLNVYNGKFYPEHYQWLNKEWENLLVLCVECSRAKSNRFPIVGDVCSIGAKGVELNQEKRLLIDPCRDFPERHFFYDEFGGMYSNTLKGRITIDILNLNRESLVIRRRASLEELKSKINSFINSDINNHLIKSEILNSINELSYAGIKRYMIARWAAEERNSYWNEIRSLALIKDYAIEENNVEMRSVEQFNIRSVKKYQSVKLRNLDDFSIENQEDLNKYYIKQRFIEWIELKNFKNLDYIHLEFNSFSKNAPWSMLLGENGIGKSSVLQAIALTLMGVKIRNKIMKNKASDYLKQGTNEGYIKIKLTGMREPVVLNFNKHSTLFFGQNHEEPKVLLLAYGSTRLLPRAHARQKNVISWARVENLFNPFVALVNVQKYLCMIDERDFAIVKKAIESMFIDDFKVIRRSNKIFFMINNSISSIEDLSDGYQTIIALVTDIMMVMKNRWRNFDAEGIVLIDELDAHLHPRWNIQIISRLRSAFPKIQFIVTSHNPLTLRGLLRGEISVMLEDEDKETYVFQDLPSQEGLKIDQLLTSKFFGLYDTMPEINKIFNEYYLLLSKMELNEDQKKRLNTLRGELENYKKLGSTMRERMFYEAIDIYIAHEKNALSGKTDQQLIDIINQTIMDFERDKFQ
ncbi:AAA family ATPase, partial [Bacillus sp. JJ664]